MSTAFDPYHKWLGIPPAEQPPHHYRLLGLAVFEHDGDVIEIAADQRMALLRSFHTGPHADLSQKLLNEVAAARLCLLRPDRRQRYDEGLRQRLADAAGRTASTSTPVASAPAETPSRVAPTVATAPRADFDLLDDLPASKPPPPIPSPAARPTPAANGAAGLGLSGIGKSGPTSPGQSGTGKMAPVKTDSVELLGKAAQRAKTDEIELVGKSAKKPQDEPAILVGKAAKKSREIELSPRSSAWDQAIADACSTQSVVHRRRRRWHVDTRVIQLVLLIAFVAGLGYGTSYVYQMWVDGKFSFSKTNTKSKWSPSPPPAATTTTNAQTATTASETTAEPEVRPVGRQPAFGTGRDFIGAPNQTDTGQSRPDETNPHSNENPSTPRPGTNSSPSPTARFPVPSADEQKRALAQVNDVFKERIRQAVSVNQQVGLARFLAQTAYDTKEPVMKYVLANEALEITVRLGDVDLASIVVGWLAASYELDGWELRYKTLGQLARVTREPAIRARVAGAAYSMVEEAIAAERFDNALELATLSMNLAASVKDPNLREQSRLLVERIKFVQKQTKAFEVATAELAADPSDRAANLIVGKYECFIKQDWEHGLVHLTKGADDILRGLAERDLKRPAQAERQIDLADAWWALADQRFDPKSEIESKGLRSRAAFWYRQAMPNLSGFMLEKARQRSIDPL